MIISEKQIMLLINIANTFLGLLDKQGNPEETRVAISIGTLLREIQQQQSDKLKEVK